MTATGGKLLLPEVQPDQAVEIQFGPCAHQLRRSLVLAESQHLRHANDPQDTNSKANGNQPV